MQPLMEIANNGPLVLILMNFLLQFKRHDSNERRPERSQACPQENQEARGTIGRKADLLRTAFG